MTSHYTCATTLQPIGTLLRVCAVASLRTICIELLNYDFNV